MPVDTKKSFVKKGENYQPVPEGFYQVAITDIELKENIETKYGLKDKFVFTLQILDTDNKGRKIFYRTSTAYSAGSGGKKNSSLYDLACAVYKERLNPEVGIDVNTLIGGQIIVALSEVEVNGSKYNNVKTVMRAKENLDFSPDVKVEENDVDQIIGKLEEGLLE